MTIERKKYANFNTTKIIGCMGLMLFSGLVNASLMKAIYHNDSFDVTTTKATTTYLEYIPLISKLFDVPEFSIWGYASAYEIDRRFENPFAPKVSEFLTTYQQVTEENSTGLIVQTYGNPTLTDTARATASFEGTPVGPDVSAGGVITTSALEGISGKLGIDLLVTQEGDGFLSSYAKAEVIDPFHFSGLELDETVWLSAGIDAGTSFTYIDSIYETQDILSVYESSITTGATTESLFSVNIGLSNSEPNTPDIVVDVSTNDLFGIDNALVTQSIYDALEFNSATSTFSVIEDIELFTLPINVATLGDLLFDPFSLSISKKADTRGPMKSPSDFDTRRYDYNGSGLERVLANAPVQDGSPVPEPHSFALVLLGLFLCQYQTRKSAS